MLLEKKAFPRKEDNTGRELIRILAADDSSDNRFLLNAFLKDYQFQLKLVENGQKAFNAFRENKYDIILMDMQMPVMNGFAATRLIREWEDKNNLPATPVLALTAYSLPDEIKQCTDAGCDGHISKPLGKKNLIEVIEKFRK